MSCENALPHGDLACFAKPLQRGGRHREVVGFENERSRRHHHVLCERTRHGLTEDLVARA
jgi:hypothetical protein